MSARERLGLYPAIEPYRQERLKVDGRYEIYFEECGNPSGKPVAIVHGGPGGGCNSTMRRYHDPARYRIILFDQRGCGRSLPHASLEANTTWHLVSDMEWLRKHSMSETKCQVVLASREACGRERPQPRWSNRMMR